MENHFVRLEPLSAEHAGDLVEAPRGLEQAWYTSMPMPKDVANEVARHRAWLATGEMNPWAIRRLDTGRAVGMTTFCNIDQDNRHVEIGHTWIGIDAQRTAVNAASKALLLAHFDECDAIAVEFRTHWHNRLAPPDEQDRIVR